jgi:acylphosphatase
VYVEAEGDEEKLNELIAWCKIGPPRARVDEVVVERHDNLRNFTRFEVVR